MVWQVVNLWVKTRVSQEIEGSDSDSQTSAGLVYLDPSSSQQWSKLPKTSHNILYHPIIIIRLHNSHHVETRNWCHLTSRLFWCSYICVASPSRAPNELGLEAPVGSRTCNGCGLWPVTRVNLKITFFSGNMVETNLPTPYLAGSSHGS